MDAFEPLARILLATADRSEHAELIEELSLRGYHVGWRGSAQEAMAALDADDYDYDALVATAGLPGGGLELCRDLAGRRPDMRTIVVGEQAAFDAAVAAMRAGAFDYLVEPLAVDGLLEAIGRARQSRKLRDEVRRLRQVLADAKGFEELLGASQPMQRLYAMLARAAETSASVLITGESGTGKEVVARALQRRLRARSPTPRWPAPACS